MSLSLSQIVLPAYQQTLPAVINILEKGALTLRSRPKRR